MRKFPLGQDRYARQYWVLPSLGGVLVEGVETSLDVNLQLESPKDFENRIDDASNGGSHGFEGFGQPMVTMPSSSHSSGMRFDNSLCNIELLSDNGTEVRGGLEKTVSDTFRNQAAEASDSVGRGIHGRCRGKEQGEGGKVGRCDSRGGKEKSQGTLAGTPSNVADGVILVSDDPLSSKSMPHRDEGKVSETQNDVLPSMEVQDSERSSNLMMVESAPISSLTSPKVSASHSAYEHAQLVSGEGEYGHTNPGIQHEGYCTNAAAVVAPAGHVTIDGMSNNTCEYAPDEGHMSEPVASQMNCQEPTIVSEANQMVQCSDSHMTSQVTLKANDHPATVMSSGQDFWFSISSRQPCESSQGAHPTDQVQSVQGSTSLNTTQGASCVLSSSPSASQSPNQQQQVILPVDATSTPQYVYVTADGQVLGAAQPQVDANVGYALVGNNCVVPYATGSSAGVGVGGQPQLVAVNSDTSTQQQVQYVMAQSDQQGGIQYVALQGGNVGAGSGLGVWPMQQQQQQPQYAMVSDQSGEQKIVQVMTNDSGGQVLVQLPSNQILGQTGEQQLMVAATQPQVNQVVLGQGQMGQLVLAAPQQQGGQVVLGQAGQAGMMVAATPQAAEMNQQVMLGSGLVVPGQSIQHQFTNHTILNQEASKQVVVAPSAEQPLDVKQQTLQADVEVSGSNATAQSQNPPEHDISCMRGGQVVQIPPQNQFGIMSSDGTKIMMMESKEVAIATLQIADSTDVSTRLVQTPQQQESSTPAVLSSTPSSANTSMCPASSYNSQHIKEEPISPNMNTAASIMAAPSTSGAAVGQSTTDGETTDLTKQGGQEDGVQVRFVIDVSGCIMFVVSLGGCMII